MLENKKQPTALQGNIIKLWADGLPNAEIADKLSCSTESVRTVKKTPEFKQMYFEIQRNQITELVPTAIKELKKVLQSDKVQATAKIAAIREVFERAHFNELTNTGEKEITITVSYE